jgi:hypothetical protein
MRPARGVDEPEGSRELLCSCQQCGAMRLARDVRQPDAIRNAYMIASQHMPHD